MADNIVSPAAETYRKSAPLLKQRWRELELHTYVKIVVIAGLFCFLFRNEINSIVHEWLTDASWSHGFLIPLFSLYFINMHKSKVLNLQTRPNFLGLFYFAAFYFIFSI